MIRALVLVLVLGSGGTFKPHLPVADGGYVLGTGYPLGMLGLNVCTQVADDTTPDLVGAASGGCNILETNPGHAGAVAITDLDNPLVGAIVYVVGADGAGASTTIADAGNFNLEATWTGTTDNVLVLYVQADNDYVEVARHNGIRYFDGVVTMASNLDVEGYAAIGNGTALSATDTLVLDQAISTATNATQLRTLGTITVTGGSSSVATVSIDPKGVDFNDGGPSVHAVVSSLEVQESGIVETVGTCTTSANIYIPDVATECDNNYNLWATDAVKIDGVTYAEGGVSVADGTSVREASGTILTFPADGQLTGTGTGATNGATLDFDDAADTLTIKNKAGTGAGSLSVGGTTVSGNVLITSNNSLYLNTDEYWFRSDTGGAEFEFRGKDCEAGAGVTGCVLLSIDSSTSDFDFGNLKAAETTIGTSVESVTFSGGGDASQVTTGSIIPAGAFVTGVTSRVVTAATTCTSVDIGIAGKDIDAFADGTAVADTTTTTHADGNAGADWSAAGLGIIPSMTAQEITVTANGGNCVNGVWAITIHYIGVTAATTD